MPTPLTLNTQIKLNSQSPSLDWKYGPYSSLDEAYATLGPDDADVICIGLTVGIQAISTDPVIEYWFKDGITRDDLVVKQSEVDLSDYYTKTEVDAKVDNVSVDLSDYYTKTETEAQIEAAETAINTNLNNYYTKTEADSGFVDVDTYNTMKTLVDEMSTTLDELTYTAPTITAFSATPSFGTREVGTSVTATAASVTITKGTKDLTSLSIKSGSTVLASKTSDITAGANSLTFSTAISSSSAGSTTLTAELTDGKSTVTRTGTYTFVYPYYYGVLDTASSVSATTVAALTKLIQTKGARTLSFDLSSKVAVFAYPTSYGSLSIIKDQNNFDVTSTFTQSSVTINSISYYVYTLQSPSNVGTFSYTFSF